MARRRWESKPETGGMAAVLLAVISIPAGLAFANWADMRAARVAWSIDGPPCPRAASAAMLYAGRLPPYVFDYGGARFTRQYGHASCVGFREDGLFNQAVYHVCQFSAPASLAVQTGPDVVTYHPGVGHHATVTIRRGKASCVMGGWFVS